MAELLSFAGDAAYIVVAAGMTTLFIVLVFCLIASLLYGDDGEEKKW